MTVTAVLRLLFDPRGRINRKGLLAVAAPLVVVQLLVYLILGILGLTSRTSGFGLVAEILFIVIALVLAAKRLHDTNLSGWWIAASLVFVVATVMACAFGFMFLAGVGSLEDGHLGYVVTLGLNVTLMMGMLLWLHCKKGTEGANRFGPEPDGLGVSYPQSDAPTGAAVMAS